MKKASHTHTNLVDDEDEVLVGRVLLKVVLEVRAASSGNVPGVEHLDHHVRAVQNLCVAPEARV